MLKEAEPTGTREIYVLCYVKLVEKLCCWCETGNVCNANKLMIHAEWEISEICDPRNDDSTIRLKQSLRINETWELL